MTTTVAVAVADAVADAVAVAAPVLAVAVAIAVMDAAALQRVPGNDDGRCRSAVVTRIFIKLNVVVTAAVVCLFARAGVAAEHHIDGERWG